jgi:magnesium transporter
LEIYGDALFLVVKTVRYLGSEERVDIGEVMVFVGSDFLALRLLRRPGPDPARLRRAVREVQARRLALAEPVRDDVRRRG